MHIEMYTKLLEFIIVISEDILTIIKRLIGL
jgi:hypothetical protein